MVKKIIPFIIICLGFVSSCTLTTEPPNLIKGVWAYSATSSSEITESFTFNDKMEYSHITTKEEGGEHVQDEEYLGTYTLSYSSFEITKASGIITIGGGSANPNVVEEKNFYFTFEAKPYANIRSLTLTSTNGESTTYGYMGSAV